jgi:hypothetical protein
MSCRTQQHETHFDGRQEKETEAQEVQPREK